jgi:hypothetical protein
MNSLDTTPACPCTRCPGSTCTCGCQHAAPSALLHAGAACACAPGCGCQGGDAGCLCGTAAG